MARIRTIKPTFFKNEFLAELPMSARMLFVGLWTLADVEGRLEDRPKRITAEVFPYDNVNVEDLLSRLQSAGFIIRYEVGEMKVIQIANWSKHQRITGKETQVPSLFPAKGNNGETIEKQPGNNRETPGKTGKEGKGKEGKGKEGKGFIAPTKDEVIKYFNEKGYTKESAVTAFDYYDAAEWHDKDGNKVRNWKQKMISVWFKPENKIKNTPTNPAYKLHPSLKP